VHLIFVGNGFPYFVGRRIVSTLDDEWFVLHCLIFLFAFMIGYLRLIKVSHQRGVLLVHSFNLFASMARGTGKANITDRLRNHLVANIYVTLRLHKYIFKPFRWLTGSKLFFNKRRVYLSKR
jgi:hypothetical protein